VPPDLHLMRSSTCWHESGSKGHHGCSGWTRLPPSIAATASWRLRTIDRTTGPLMSLWAGPVDLPPPRPAALLALPVGVANRSGLGGRLQAPQALAGAGMGNPSATEPSGPCGADWHSATPEMKTDHGRAAAGHDPFCTFLGERPRMSIECFREEINRPCHEMKGVHYSSRQIRAQ
jgi:hypothetical protein